MPVVGLTTEPTGEGAAVETAVLLRLPLDLEHLVALVGRFCGES